MVLRCLMFKFTYNLLFLMALLAVVIVSRELINNYLEPVVHEVWNDIYSSNTNSEIVIYVSSRACFYEQMIVRLIEFYPNDLYLSLIHI